MDQKTQELVALVRLALEQVASGNQNDIIFTVGRIQHWLDLYDTPSNKTE